MKRAFESRSNAKRFRNTSEIIRWKLFGIVTSAGAGFASFRTLWDLGWKIIYGSIGSRIVGAVMAKHFYNVPMHVFFPIHFAFWMICDMIVMARMGQRPTLKLMGVWALREMSHVPLWCQIAISNTILWRGQKLKPQLRWNDLSGRRGLA